MSKRFQTLTKSGESIAVVACQETKFPISAEKFTQERITHDEPTKHIARRCLDYRVLPILLFALGTLRRLDVQVRKQAGHLAGEVVEVGLAERRLYGASRLGIFGPLKQTLEQRRERSDGKDAVAIGF